MGFLWGAYASRVLAMASRHRGLSKITPMIPLRSTAKDCCGETPQPTRETRALPRTAELDSLCERKLRRKVNRVGLAAHIALPGIAPALAPAAGIFLAAKRTPNFSAARAGVHVRDSAITPNRADEFFRLAYVVLEDGTGQALRNAVLDGDRFIEIAISQQIEQRTKRLFMHDLEIRL